VNYLLIQPATIEDVLASMCYVAYWNDTALRRAGHHVELHEDCTYKEAQDAIAQWKGGPVLVDVSSPPQVETALALWRGYRHTHDLRFIGYEPLVVHHGLPFFHLAEAGTTLSDGVHHYLYDWDRYRYAYATIDGHLLCAGDDRPFVPGFWGVGCLRGCEYCYINRETYPYDFCSLDEGTRLIDYMIDRGWNIHFEDENFFLHPHAYDFLRHLRGRGTKWIVLTDSLLLNRAIDKFGVDELLECGHWLSEVGIETTDPSVLGKRQDIGRLLELANQRIDNRQDGTLNLFWLAVTLLPDETLASLNRNGRFYETFGVAYERIEPRLRTQTSAGGLGQFFTPYPGTKFWSRVQQEGKWLAEPTLRLRPSWAGNALLNDVPEVGRELQWDDWRWVMLYAPTRALVERVLARCNGARTVAEVTELEPEALAVLCCLAKLRCIVPKGGEQVDDASAIAAQLTRKRRTT